MGKRRTVKKIEMNSQEPSSSSSKKNRKRTMDKTNNSQKQKKLKKESKTKVYKLSINDLPPEMLMKVLKNVDSRSLLGCRLVSRKWNGIASAVLQSRDDLQLYFDFYNDNKTLEYIKYTYRGEIIRGGSLFTFNECFQNSSTFPFAHFYFRHMDSSLFDQSDWIQFISDFGENIKGVKLGVNANASILNTGDLTKLTEKVRDLLLSKLPKLEKFGLSLDYHHPTPHSTTIQLFPTSAENPNSKPSTSTRSKTTSVRLPHLKVLYLEEEMFLTHTEIVTDLFHASVNLQKLESFSNSRFKNMMNLLFIRSFGKLDCLQAANIKPVEILSQLMELKENPSAPLVFKLRESNVNSEILYKNENLWADATIFLSNLFESSKDTLTELIMQPLGFLSDLQFPKFSKLISLSTQEKYSGTPRSVTPGSLLPAGINPMEIFPVLRSLDLGVPWSKAFPNERFISGIPTLETLKVTGKEMNASFIPQISVLCPNLKDFEISRHDDSPMRNFPDVGRAIWTHLKQLQSLEVYLIVYVKNHWDAFPAFDSCITGFSKDDCTRLYKLLMADKLLKESGSRGKVTQSELKAERIFPSILDLEDLGYFQLHILCSNRTRDFDFNADLTQVGPTLLSEKSTLDHIDDLRYNTNKVHRD